ncbi:240d33d0-3fcf-403d-99d6-2502f0071114 [Sclerotinia trifoliorum]|uniref:DNA ligase n=1 Tax=Sclerotinia trifoliorum TaxID=28548 RepID=A0A8H2VSB3_9HELO|nr:240d33d0-3fcf-403d-99d6-2502f0071114 [Sclerotinia trifoliorum]
MASSQQNKNKKPSPEAIADDERQYAYSTISKEELNDKHPDRPRNHGETLPFHELFQSLFDPLEANKNKKPGPAAARKKLGPHGPNNLSPNEIRKNIIVRFMSRWRSEVGDDFYPALRLIIPEKDRDRAMYGLKEASVGRLIIKLLNLSKDSDDGYNLINWKLPARGPPSANSGDFPGRCYEVLSKRPMRQKVGDMTIGEVNEMLDKLALAQKEENQLPIFREFYQRMNAEELVWLIRMILRQMKIGASEKTFLNLWHPDGEALFNVSSSLRRVCWELTDPNVTLEADETGVELMSCFQPQLAQFMSNSFEKMVEKMCAQNPHDKGNNSEFWIEEKLDGERIQMHMEENDDIPGGRRFIWWSRKGKDYTYLYGNGFEDDNSALTRHMKNAFDPRVSSIILDGEMITWDPVTNKMVAFGTLKTAAISGGKDPFSATAARPVFKVFDCLYVNGKNITKYTLKDRRNVLESSVQNVEGRIEKHNFTPAKSSSEIDPLLRKIVAEGSEGLVLKNPLSMYRLNSRNDDWMKVKPEYMTGFGESLDCIIIGGYYGSGYRGGNLASFLCGLRVDDKQIRAGANPMKCFSFFKVGGGFNADDYAAIRHQTDGKWIKWDAKSPPTEFIELAGTHQEKERPDVWIKPNDSIVIEVKAASVSISDSFRTNFTLRFPRFKRLRPDKDWKSALSIEGFMELKAKVEEGKDDEFRVDKKKKPSKRLKREKIIAGTEEDGKVLYEGPNTGVFEGMDFCILSDMILPVKKSKAEIETIIKNNGGRIYQSPSAKEDIIVVADKRVVKVASLIKSGKTNIVKPQWVLHAVAQMETDATLGRSRFVIPYETGHMLFTREEDKESIAANSDQYGDPYCRDVGPEELRGIMDGMGRVEGSTQFDAAKFMTLLAEKDKGFGNLKGWTFRGCRGILVTDGEEADLNIDIRIAMNHFEFACGAVLRGEDVETHVQKEDVTHIIFAEVSPEKIRETKRELGGSTSHLVSWKWIRDSWDAGTRLDENGYLMEL